MLLPLLLALADPQTAANLLHQGLLALQSGQIQQAQTDLAKASTLDPANPYIWSSLAETHRRLHQPEAAFAAAAQAEQTGASDPRVAHALAIFYTAAERPDKAAPLERTFAESSQADPQARERAAALYLNANDPATAADVARAAITAHDTPAAEDTLARALTATGHPDEALPHFKKAWELSPAPDPQIAFDYAQSLLQKQSFDEVAAIAIPTLRAHPGDPQMQLVLGVARYGQRRFNEAIDAFLDVIRLDPAIPQPYLFLGNLVEQAGPALERIVAADRAWATREPQNGQAKLTLAKALLQSDRRSPEARTLLEQAIALRDDSWEAHYQLGTLLETARDYPAAATELRRSIQLNPQQPLPHYHLARVYDRLNQPDDARRERDLHQSLNR